MNQSEYVVDKRPLHTALLSCMNIWQYLHIYFLFETHLSDMVAGNRMLDMKLYDGGLRRLQEVDKLDAAEMQARRARNPARGSLVPPAPAQLVSFNPSPRDPLHPALKLKLTL